MSITLTALQKQRRDTAANWTTANPTLLAGEIGLESDTGYWKVGDGSTAWTSLAYVPGLGAEIPVSRLADGTARQLLQTAANGTDVEWTSNVDVPGTLDVTGVATFDNNVIVQGDLTVNGTTTTIDTTNLAIEDKNIEIGKVATPTDVTADGGGITLKGTTDKTINWVDATDAWTFSEHINIASGKEYRIAGAKVLDATSLGSAVVSSSLTSVGTIGTGTWQGTAINKTYLDSTLVSTGDTGTVTSTMIADGTIVNGDINASAAIAGTKISPDFGSQNTTTTGTSTAASFIPTSSTAPTNGVYLPAANSVAISTNGSGRLFVDANGNIGVGVSPSAWNTDYRVIQLKGGGAISNDGGNTDVRFSQNAFVDSGALNKYIATAAATRYRQSSGVHIWETAASGTAGNTITFNEGMRLTSTGLGIGTTAPSYALDVRTTGTSISSSFTSDQSEQYIALKDSGTTIGHVRLGSTSGSMLFFAGNGERGRFDSSGRLLVGTSTARGNFFNTTGQEPAFQVEGTTNQTARISVTRCSNDDAASLLIFGKSRSASVGGNTIVAQNDFLGGISFQGADGSEMVQGAFIYAEVDGTPGANDMPGRLVFSTTPDSGSSPVERLRITNDGTITTKTSGATSFGSVGFTLYGTAANNGSVDITRSGGQPLAVNRLTNDGNLIEFFQDTTLEGSISVSGTTVSYNGAHLSRWSQLPSDAKRTEILRGTVLSNIDEMCEWGEEENEQLNRMKVSDVEGDKNVAGVFQAWDEDDDTYTNDFYCAMTGDFIIRIAAGVTVERGDLLMSAGDGTAKPQDDDIIRSKTIAKVTSTNVSCTYDDGSYCVPCVLMAC